MEDRSSALSENGGPTRSGHPAVSPPVAEIPVWSGSARQARPTVFPETGQGRRQ